MQIPVDRLDPDTLTRVIEEFVSREGTDYGLAPQELDAKVENIRRKLKSGQAVLCSDQDSETCQILTREAVHTLQKGPVGPPQGSAKDLNIDF